MASIFKAILAGIAVAISVHLLVLDVNAEGPKAKDRSGLAGRQYYVSPKGSDRYEGSQKHPWQTIQRAALVVAPGDTVHVLAGVYRGRVDTVASGLVDARITYISEQKWGAQIVGDVIDRSTWDNKGNYVDIVGFDVSGVGRTGLYNDASHVRFIGNHVHDIAGPTGSLCNNGGAGIFNGSYSGFDNDTIGNRVHDIGWTNASLCLTSGSQVHGIYHANPGGHILNNVVYHNRAYGIHLWHAASGVIISGNTVFNNGSSGMVVGAGGEPKGSRADNCLVSSNIFAYNHNYGFRDDSGTTGPNNKYDNNLTFNNGNGDYVASGGTVSGNISNDPQFVNYTGTALGNYQLRATSPAIDSGTTLNAPSSDLDGGTRPLGAGYDIGCYEYGAAPGTWPWY